jgi:RNA polymerase sigma-70 factor (ECF subfamily)
MASPNTQSTVGSARNLEPNDQELVTRIQSGDADAMRIVYDRYGRKVTAVAMSVIRDRDLAADIAQDVFVRLWHRADRFDSRRGSLGSFLAVDAHGRSIDLLRSRNASARRELNDFVRRSGETPIGTEEQALQGIVASTVRASLEELPDEQRIPITLAYFDGLPYRQVAELLKMPEGTVKSRIRSGLQQLGMTLVDVPTAA